MRATTASRITRTSPVNRRVAMILEAAAGLVAAGHAALHLRDA
jgi:hypothetical protein